MLPKTRCVYFYAEHGKMNRLLVKDLNIACVLVSFGIYSIYLHNIGQFKASAGTCTLSTYGYIERAIEDKIPKAQKLNLPTINLLMVYVNCAVSLKCFRNA